MSSLVYFEYLKIFSAREQSVFAVGLVGLAAFAGFLINTVILETLIHWRLGSSHEVAFPALKKGLEPKGLFPGFQSTINFN